MIRLAWINSQRPHMSSSLHKKLTGRRSSRDIKRITLNSWVERIPFAHWQKTEPKKSSDHNSSGEQWAMHLSLSSIGGGGQGVQTVHHFFIHFGLVSSQELQAASLKVFLGQLSQVPYLLWRTLAVRTPTKRQRYAELGQLQRPLHGGSEGTIWVKELFINYNM